MRIEMSHLKVDGTPDEIDWFAEHDQDHLRYVLAAMNYRMVADASMAVMPPPAEDENINGDGNQVLVVHRGGKAQEPPQDPEPEGNDDK